MADLKRDDNGVPIQILGQYGTHTTFTISSETKKTLEAGELYEFSANGSYVYAMGTTTMTAVSTSTGRYDIGISPRLEKVNPERYTLSVLGLGIGIFPGATKFTYVKVG